MVDDSDPPHTTFLNTLKRHSAIVAPRPEHPILDCTADTPCQARVHW